MELLQGIDLSTIKIAKGGDRVYKEECIYSFETPESDGGLYVSLHSFFGVGRQWLELHHRKTNDRLYLHIVRREIPKPPKPIGEEPPEKKPTRLALGVEGGFTGGIEKVEYEDTLKVVIFPGCKEIQLPCAELPQKVKDSVQSILSAESANKQDSLLAWEGDERKVSKFAETLQQLDNGVKIPPSGWKCEKCDLTNNLWLNLTDGSIMCGRKYYDGSGGNNHAVDYYDTTKYPLAVKLGTITPGGADVYSYAEDDMVLDPQLPEHLSHFGIDMMIMSKTEKTMTELEIDINMRIGEWSIIQESGQDLKLLYGSGYTGLQNLGNSCYVNSVMQVLFSLSEFQSRYFDKSISTFTKAVPDPTKDLNFQLTKLALGLLSGEYSKKPSGEDHAHTVGGAEDKPTQKEQKGIKPLMFKTLIGTGHREFSSSRQQDAQEFFLHLMNLIDRAEHASPDTENVVDLFRYQVEEKIKCTKTNKVRYSEKPEFLLTLPVTMDTATNAAEVKAWEEKKAALEAEKQKINHKEAVRAKVPFVDCLSQYSKASIIPDFYSSALQAKSPATRTYRFSSFPKYLLVQLAKFTFSKTWEPIKYDVEINVPESLDLTHLRAQGILPGEELLPAEGPNEQPKQVEIDEGIVMQLMSMGFNIEGCKRAVFHTNNQGVEPAMNWVLEHMGDPDFETPFDPNPAPSGGQKGGVVSEDGIAMVMALGFSRDQAVRALQETDNNIERAADWVFSHMDELAQLSEQSSSASKSSPKAERKNFTDGSGKYKLVAFISHMGTSTMTGHYVCHVKKDGRWVIFNDNKVAESVAPPKGLGYLYLFERESS